MTSVGIVGSGISGLQLALFLQHFGLDATVYAEKTPAEMRDGRLPNTVARFSRSQARERLVGADQCDPGGGGAVGSGYIWIKGDPPLQFRGDLREPASFVDFRVYLPGLLETFAAKGGTVRFGRIGPDDLPALAATHDVVVVATGAKSLTEIFPRVAERSPYDGPQRRLMAGLFRGIAQADPVGLTLAFSSAGEVFQAQFYSVEGAVPSLLVEAIPGGPMEPIATMPYEEDPARFEAALLELLAEFATPVYDRIDRKAFGLTRPVDLLQGAITPTVRQAWAPLDGGTFALAVGDTWIQNDPVVGQGANLGSDSAWVMAEAISGASWFDERFCREVEERMWDFARPVTEWTNAALQPPPPHVVGISSPPPSRKRWPTA